MPTSLDLKIIEEKIRVNDEIKESFQIPFIFYLLNFKNPALPIFVIVDFQKETMTYVNSFLSNNIKFIKSLNDKELLQTPHSSVGNSSCFYNFIFNIIERNRSPLIRKIDVQNKKMTVIYPEDLPIDQKNVRECCDTTVMLDENNFLLSYLNDDGNYYYKVSTDLKNAELLFKENIMKTSPHQISPYKNWVVGTGFFDREINCLEKTFYNENQLIDYVKNIGRCDDHQYNFKRDLFSIDPFTRQLGYIIAHNLKTNETHKISTITAPAHVEIDPYNDMFYISSNNMIWCEGSFCFLGEGTVEKFKITEDKIFRMGVFHNHKGFRFTTHKLFWKNNKCYIAIFGHPNRLFIVDSETMKLETYRDIGPDYLSNQEDVRSYINFDFPQDPIHPHRMAGMCVSKDNKFIIFPDQENLLFFNTDLLQVTHKLNFKKDSYFNMGKIMGRFGQFSLHCDFLEN